MNSSNVSLLSDTYIVSVASTTVNLILSLPTNSYVVWLIATGAGGTLAAEFLPLNLAVFEILLCLLSVFYFLRNIFPEKHVSGLPNSFLLSGRPMLQCCICIEQFLAVVHPVLFLRYKLLRHKVAFCGVAWAIIIAFSVFYTFSPNIKHLVFVSECVVLISVMLFCYFSVLVALKRPQPGDGKRGRDNNIKRRAFFTILMIIVSFVGTYLFWCVVIFSNVSNWTTDYRILLTRISTLLTFASGFVQPLLYLQKTGKYSCNKAV